MGIGASVYARFRYLYLKYVLMYYLPDQYPMYFLSDQYPHRYRSQNTTHNTTDGMGKNLVPRRVFGHVLTRGDGIYSDIDVSVVQ